MSFLFSNPQSAAAGQMYSNSANAYNDIQTTVNPFLTTQMQQGFSPATYSAAQNRTNASGLQAINTLQKGAGDSVPNLAGQTGDALNSTIMGDASTSATLAGQSQQYQDQAAQAIGGNDQAVGSGYANLGQQYQQAAAQEGSPFSSLLSIASMFVPGGQLGSIGSLIGNLFSGSGGGGLSPALSPGGSGVGFGEGPSSYSPGNPFNLLSSVTQV